MRYFLLFFCTCLLLPLTAQGDQPNILLVIADDLGVDHLRGYHDGDLMATTPTLDSLRSVGVTFTNVFAAPKCTPTRAAILSGKYGVKTGVTGTPGTLDLTHESLFDALTAGTGAAYADALIGKWHLTQPLDAGAPQDHGADYYMGLLGPAPEGYDNWQRTENGSTATSTEYVTTALTDAAIDWVAEQTKPWFLWLAHAAPHSPFHVPPAGTYSLTNVNGRERQYVAMIENLDYELNRLLQSLDLTTRENTLILFVGDNGTPRNVLQDYPDRRGKGTLYQGGVRVPLVVAGQGVSRPGTREAALVNVADLHATVLAAAGVELPGGVFNSLSFHHLLGEDPDGQKRAYNYTELRDGDNTGWTIRDTRYKLIDFANGNREFYDLTLDSFELSNLLSDPLTEAQQTALDDLRAEATVQRDGWSCRDLIQNGAESGIDCGTNACGMCTTSLSPSDFEEIGMTVFPNPFTHQFRITAQAPITELEVWSMQGRLLSRQTGNNRHSLRVEARAFPAGNLLVVVKTTQGSGRGKLVKHGW